MHRIIIYYQSDRYFYCNNLPINRDKCGVCGIFKFFFSLSSSKLERRESYKNSFKITQLHFVEDTHQIDMVQCRHFQKSLDLDCQPIDCNLYRHDLYKLHKDYLFHLLIYLCQCTDPSECLFINILVIPTNV